VLQVDHIVPVCEGGSDDLINLATSCWECNSGKSGVPLSEIVTGEDPHDRAVMLLERERQLREYNEVLRAISARKEIALAQMETYWREQTGSWFSPSDSSWVMNQLDIVPETVLDDALRIAARAGKTRSLAYVAGIVRNWRERNR
jgi:hypothetical protein